MKRFILSLIILLAFGFTVTFGQSQEKVKVLGTELEQWLSKYTVYAGTNDLNGCVFMVVSHSADRREAYYNCPSNERIESAPFAGTGKGTARVDGDRLCETWVDLYPGWEQCAAVYRIGENRYEQLNGTKKFYMLK